jgi:MOSC domain-containing protein YiiM
MARRLNIDGDGQGDLDGHGGEMRAVLVYQIQSYDYCQRLLKRDDFTFGQFGENLTVDGLSDDEVYIGDRYLIGEAEFEVTQPRVTCYRLGLRMGEPSMPSLLAGHRRPGFYMRVITEGRLLPAPPPVMAVDRPGLVRVQVPARPLLSGPSVRPGPAHERPVLCRDRRYEVH